MFDPSKLDLDLDENLDKKRKQTPLPSESDKISQSKNVDPNTTILETESKIDSDFLGDLLKENNNTSELLGESDSKIEAIEIPKLKDIEKAENIQEDENKENDSYGVENKVEYNKEKIQENQKNEIKEDTQIEKIIFDTNINNIQDVFHKIIENSYDFVTIEPFDDCVKIIYRKDKVIKETFFIKFPAYTQILIKAKTLTKLKVDESDSEQEGSGNITLKSKGYKVLSKTAPGGYGEKIFLKLQETQVKVKKEKKNISFLQILGFLGAALFTVLLIGGGFLTFVLLNASTVAELTFFNNLGVDVGSIRDFTAKLVNGLFSVIILIETLFLFTFTFKALLTKKDHKKEKIARIILSVFFLILTFLSGFLWITLSQKINELKGQNYGKMLTYDNEKYLSPLFDDNGSLININESLIGPVTLRFNITEILNQLVNDNNYTPQKVTWIFEDEEIEKPVNDLELIHTFSSEGLHEVNLKIDVLNALGESEFIESTIAKLNIDHIVEVNEKVVAGGGKIYQFDASSLKDLGKIEWFYIPDLQNLTEQEKTKAISIALKQPANSGYLFDTKPLFDQERILGIKILSGGEEKDNLDKIFVFSGDTGNDDIKADIVFEQNFNNAFEYTFNASNIETVTGNGNIDHFLWKIGDKTINNDAILTDLEKSSEIEFTFDNYGDYTIYLDIVDSRGNTQTIEKNITIDKRLELSRQVRISNDNASIENLTYDENLHEYVIDEIGVPTNITLDARFIKTTDTNYVLRNVEWDFGSDDDIDSTEKNTTYEVSYEGNHQITGIFYFEHRKKPEDTVIMTEKIYIEGVKKEAQLLFEITSSRDYVPVTVAFDASKSQVKDENIVKFTWDYGDGEIEIRDAIVPGHKYSEAGDYEIKLMVTTASGKEYSASKKLILKPKPQSIKITSSLKMAPIYQPIDFLSDESEGQISSYFWDFGDGGTSTQANPSHAYAKSGIYNVTLRLDFTNNNVLTDEVNVQIIDE